MAIPDKNNHLDETPASERKVFTMGRSESAIESWQDLLKKVGLEQDLAKNTEIADNERESRERVGTSEEIDDSTD